MISKIRSIHTLLFLLCLQILSAQNISVTSFKLLGNDLTANTTGTMERDQNGEIAALIKVVTTEQGFVFDGGMTGIVKTKQGVGEVWVYVPHGIKRITIQHPQLGVLRDYYFQIAIDKAKTYEMVLTTGRVETVVTHSTNKQYVTFSVTPTNAIVELDGQILNINKEGYVEKLMPYGRYNYRVYCANYHTDAGVVEVTAQNKTKVAVTLRPNFGWIDFVGEENFHGANIYIDNEYVGQLPLKSNSLKSGTHQIKVLKPLYKPYEQQTIVNDGETTSLEVKMLPNFANVTFKADAESEIWIDDQLQGKGQCSMALEMGEYTVHVKRNAHRTVSDIILINETNARTIQLQSPIPIYGVVDITSTPSDAIVYIDDVRVGETPLIKSDVLIGSHKITIEKEGYETMEETINVEAGADNVSSLCVSLRESQKVYTGRGNSTFPSWMAGVADKNLWIGVSPPTEDRYIAREQAIQNAVFYYFCVNGGGTLKTACSNEVNSLQRYRGANRILLDEEVEYVFNEAVLLAFEKFSVRVVEEYYNKRGEYFVACELRQDRDTENVLTISRDWVEDTERGYTQCHIASLINGSGMDSYLEINYGTEGVTCTMTSENVPWVNVGDWNYPKMQLSTLPYVYGYGFALNRPLGVSQMACLAMSPFIADEISHSGMICAEESFDGGEIRIVKNFSHDQFIGHGKSLGFDFSFFNIKRNSIEVSVKDISTERDQIYNENILERVGCSNAFANRPLLLSKINAYYNALSQLSAALKSTIETQSTVNEQASTLTNTYNSTFKIIMPPHDIDWYFDFEQKSSEQGVRVVSDIEIP